MIASVMDNLDATTLDFPQLWLALKESFFKSINMRKLLAKNCLGIVYVSIREEII